MKQLASIRLVETLWLYQHSIALHDDQVTLTAMLDGREVTRTIPVGAASRQFVSGTGARLVLVDPSVMTGFPGMILFGTDDTISELVSCLSPF